MEVSLNSYKDSGRVTQSSLTNLKGELERCLKTSLRPDISIRMRISYTSLAISISIFFQPLESIGNLMGSRIHESLLIFLSPVHGRVFSTTTTISILLFLIYRCYKISSHHQMITPCSCLSMSHLQQTKHRFSLGRSEAKLPTNKEKDEVRTSSVARRSRSTCCVASRSPCIVRTGRRT